MRPGSRSSLAAGLAVTSVVFGCSDLVLVDDPPAGPEAVASAMWTEVDEYYAHFGLKQVDWDAVGAAHLPSITNGTRDSELFSTLSAMVLELRDGHVVLESPFGRTQWTGWHDTFPVNYRASTTDAYLSQPRGSGAQGSVRWGRLTDGVGYVHISSFGSHGIGAAVDAALTSLQGVDAMIVDVRNNGGGSDTQSQAAAGRFIGDRVHYRTVRYKDGPGHDDFGPEIRDFIEPAGRRAFDGPVAVLQNRRVFSAAEDFVIAMRVRSGVTFVGDFTGGGAGNPIPRELPNHWLVHVPRWLLWAADGTQYEGVGLAPDLRIDSPDEELDSGRDAILEAAIELLQTG